jgi:cobalamin biosynthesis Mg chelatase CobN
MTSTIVKVERGKSDDNRRTETRIEEVTTGSTTERITTVMEETVPMEIKKVVRETIMPVVTTRKIDQFQEGKVVQSDVEIVPDQQMNLIKSSQDPITKNDIYQIVKSVLSETNLTKKDVVKLKNSDARQQPEVFKSSNKSVRATLEQKFNQDKSTSSSMMDYLLLMVLAVICGGIVYFMFIKNVVSL